MTARFERPDGLESAYGAMRTMRETAGHSLSIGASGTVIEARPGWQAIQFAELWHHRELLYFLTWRDIKVRYKQTVVGAAMRERMPASVKAVALTLDARLRTPEARW